MSKKIKKQIPRREESKISEKPSTTLHEGISDPLKSQKKSVKSQIVSNSREGGVTVFFWAILFTVVFGCGVYATKPLWVPYVLNYLPSLETSTNLQSADLLQ